MWQHLWPGGTWWSGFDAIWPNIAASLIIAPIVWFWKIRPHFKRQAAARARTNRMLESLHAHHGIPVPEEAP